MVDRDVVVVAQDGMQDFFTTLPVALGPIPRQLSDGRLPFMVGRLADNRATSRSAGPVVRLTPALRHQAAKMRDFKAML